MPGNEHTVSEHSKTPGIAGATTSSDTAISDIAISDTAIVDPVVTALAELQQNARPSPLHKQLVFITLRRLSSDLLVPFWSYQLW
jgi:hypothetical protein